VEGGGEGGGGRRRRREEKATRDTACLKISLFFSF